MEIRSKQYQMGNQMHVFVCHEGQIEECPVRLLQDSKCWTLRERYPVGKEKESPSSHFAEEIGRQKNHKTEIPLQVAFPAGSSISLSGAAA